MGPAPDGGRHTQCECIPLPHRIPESKQQKRCKVEQHDHDRQPSTRFLTHFHPFPGFRLLFLLYSHPALHP